MTWLDYLVLTIILASILWGVWKGLVHEVISVAAWVLAFLGANLFAGPLGDMLPEALPTPEIRVLVAFVLVFIAILAVCTLLGRMLSKLVKVAGLGDLDRSLGGVFGLARALMIALAIAVIAGLTGLPRQPGWQNSISGPLLTQAVLAFKPWLPRPLALRLRYH
ncbi:MAG: CvpA family protein [Proteobacteria bacterium]|nr:CvpA family protein [Pseudomonadota bacterium]